LIRPARQQHQEIDMSAWDRIVNFIARDAEQLANGAIKEGRVSPSHAQNPNNRAHAEQHYFRVKLAHMFLKDKARFGQSLYPAVHSLVQTSFAGKVIDLPNLIDSSRLFENQEGKGDLVVKNFVLTPLLPFKGGNVRVLTGLFAVKGDNLIANLMSTLGNFAKLLAVPQLSSALDIAAPLAEGVQALASGAGMHLGYHNSFVDATGSGNFLSTGYQVIVRSDDRKLLDRLMVIDDVLYEGKGLDDPGKKPFAAADYLLLHIEVRDTRDDFNSLSSIAEPYSKCVDALAENDTAKADLYLRQALAAALKAEELTRADRRRVIDQLKQDYAAIAGDLKGQNLLDAPRATLQELMNHAARAVPSARAVALAQPELDDILR
jgi:hypothetical protein